MTASLRELDLREYGDWPLMHRAAACVLLALLAFGLPWSLLTRPTSAQWQALKSAEHDIQTRLLHARQRVDALPAWSPLLPDLITTIAETAQSAGLHGGQFRPMPPPATDAPTDAPTDAISIELRLHGIWPQLARFAADLAALKSDAILSLRDIRLRVQSQTAASAPLLELSATVLIYPYANALSAQPVREGPQRNPFIDSSIRSRQTHSHTVIGRLGNGHDQVGLVLTKDGQLRRVHPPHPARGQ